MVHTFLPPIYHDSYALDKIALAIFVALGAPPVYSIASELVDPI